MVGNYEQVHGWNPFFRATPANAQAQRFHCFDWAPPAGIFTIGRPTNFSNLPVAGNYRPPVALDHQGHIVPQNILDVALDGIATQAFNHAPRPATLAALDGFLNALRPLLGFQHVTNYVNFLIANGAPAVLFVNPTAANVEDYVGGYFSVIMWNPVNICRAPADGRRKGTPGNEIDVQVIPRLTIGHQLDAAFRAIPPNPTVADTEAFIAEINDELNNLQVAPAGYYQFHWKDEPTVADILAPL